jgi:hypothetical protein
MNGVIDMTKRKTIPLIFPAIMALAFLNPPLGYGEKTFTQAKPSLPKIQKAVICEKVESRTPWGIRGAYPSTIENLYCFTELTGIPSEGTIYHIWYRGKREVAKVGLSVAPPQWRTWSSKIILANWKGDWSVEIVWGDHILKTLTFSIE